jgi:hypothetical protein
MVATFSLHAQGTKGQWYYSDGEQEWGCKFELPVVDDPDVFRKSIRMVLKGATQAIERIQQNKGD